MLKYYLKVLLFKTLSKCRMYWPFGKTKHCANFILTSFINGLFISLLELFFTGPQTFRETFLAVIEITILEKWSSV